jgi:hypothetical protein
METGVTGVRAIQFSAVAHAVHAGGRRNRALRLLLVLAILAAGVVAVPLAHPSATSSTLAPQSLTRARLIRAEVTARYRTVPGRKLAVTEATSTAVVRSITLVTDRLEPRVLPTDNGIYFAICSSRARCPYPGRSAAWRAAAFLPRRQALELALRTFLETSVDLVLVALPTAEPVWLVFERDEFLASIDPLILREQLSSDPAATDEPLRELVGRLTRLRLFVPLPILPPPDNTIYALRLFEP